MRPAAMPIVVLGLAPLAAGLAVAVPAPTAAGAADAPPPAAASAPAATGSARTATGLERTATGSARAVARAPEASAGRASSGRRVVVYRGVEVPVPRGWEVHRLDAEPGACVRLDRRAIYLGTPGEQSSCPARVVGGAEAVLIRPTRPGPAAASPSTIRRTGPVRPDRLASMALPARRDGVVRVPLPEAGVTITGLYGEHPAALRRVLRSTRLSAGWTHDPESQWPHAPGSQWPDDPGSQWPRDPGSQWPHDPAPRPAYVLPEVDQYADQAAARTRREPQREWASGRGFDACAAPSLRAMRAWRSAYSVANVYIGGVSRGCAQPHLNAGWVRAVRAMGYRLIPTYVGPQAPCTRHRARFDARRPERAARAAAADAVARARALGIPRSKPIYYDMEAYRSHGPCRTAVLRFLQAWTLALGARDYPAGIYSGASTGIRDLGWAKGFVKPRSIWFAHWDGKASVYGSSVLPNRWWSPHRRIKQYRGDHRESHGGVTLYVDSNVVDGRVY
ncbi:DUF1906 domain-containing protein [Actinomadura rupiterrae]|uniref:DUF1906 domain-containing protein n=1 Tax=Actinomadura rupiterrae TaxID=559627 RepID=UPI0020A53182|nr:DUF1906 domain-containing protein [Actinomadura rupiterrae]MCP2338764.1 hypothetical protein [Actinomadura rupiterrae]